MKFFTKNFFLTSTVLAICLFSACVKKEGAKRATAFDVFGITETKPDKDEKEIIFTDDSAFERGDEQIFVVQNTIIEPDGSQITALKDAFGNITYQRTFRNNPLVKKVLVLKNQSGGQITYIYGQNGGKIVRITDETEENFLKMSVDELAARADLQKPIEINSFDEPKIRSSLPVNSAPVADRKQPNYSEIYDGEFSSVTENDHQPPAQTEKNPTNAEKEIPQTTDN